jgi:basic amino acid/polyamine antiporter, APA family
MREGGGSGEKRGTRLEVSWSGRDAFIYAFFSINLVTLGLYIISQAWRFKGGLLPALALGAALILSEAVVYAGMIAAMPRSGGDYLWQSAILGRGPGFVLAITGWCFILWLWTPIYGDILRQVVLVPLAAVLGFGPAALALSGSPAAWFAVCALMCLFVLVVIAKGMRAYARMQRFCFWLGNAGLLVVIALLFLGDEAGYEKAFDAGVERLFGIANAYRATMAAGEAAGASTPLSGGSLGQVLLLLPYLAFFNLWPNCGASLSGEVRGAGSFRRNLWVMGGALVATTALLAVLLVAIDKAMGWRFYMDANAAYWSARQDPGAGPAALPFWPYPVLLALLPIPSTAFRVAVLLAMAAWFFGWAGTIYLSSSRILFSAAFDRLLPFALAQVDARTKTPFKALLFMVVPGLLVSALYVWNVFGFASLTLASTAVIAATFLGTGIAAVALPFAKPELYRASPLASFRIGPVPLISAFGLVFCAFLGYLLFEWLIDPGDLYGISLRNATSVAFLVAVYLLGLLLYLVLRGFRRRSGVDLDSIFEDEPEK